jgi:hypothetical protein
MNYVFDFALMPSVLIVAITLPSSLASSLFSSVKFCFKAAVL